MRKTRVRRRFKKRSATPRKTRKNIHKSKKQKISRRYSRRRVMRVGVPTGLVYFNQHTVLLGYGIYNGDKTFILYSRSDEKFYYFYNKKIQQIINDPSITIYLPISIPHPSEDLDAPDTILYNEKHLEKIIQLFENNNIKYVTENEGRNQFGPLPINIQIKDKYFNDFLIAHSETHDKNVLFANFQKYDPKDPTTINLLIFYFQDKKGDIFQTDRLPIELFIERSLEKVGNILTEPQYEPDLEYKPLKQITDSDIIKVIKEGHEVYRREHEAYRKEPKASIIKRLFGSF